MTEEKIRAFVPEEYWLLDADLSRIEKTGSFTARFVGTETKKTELKSEDDVKEVATNFECGIGLTKFNDIKEGDIFEAFIIEEYRD